MDDMIAVLLYWIWHCGCQEYRSQANKSISELRSSWPTSRSLAYQMIGPSGVCALSFAAGTAPFNTFINDYGLYFTSTHLPYLIPTADVKLGSFYMSI